jgi:hypothetical protein
MHVRPSSMRSRGLLGGRYHCGVQRSSTQPGADRVARPLVEAMLLAAVGALGCNPPPPDGCGHGHVELSLDPARSDFPPLADGREVPVFIPPQGGIFTELDLTVRGLSVEDITMVEVTFDASDGERLADQRYPGHAVPLLCFDDAAHVPRMPVRFAEHRPLETLDGIEGELMLRVQASDGHARGWHVVLRVTEY